MRDIGHGILHGLVVAGILLAFAAWAPAQTPAPYVITSENPLVIERQGWAPPDTVAFLEYIDGAASARTDATRAGFDFTGTQGDAGYTGIVFRLGPGEDTWRTAIEIPGGHLSAPAVYEHNPWDWGSIKVWDGPIKPDEHSFGFGDGR